MTRRTTPDEQTYLAGLWHRCKRKNCAKARAELIEHYGYLVTKTRQRIVPQMPVRVLPEDIEQEGQIALVRAVDQFDLGRNVKFESYAISMIRGAMLEHLRRDDWVPRIIRSKQRLVRAAEEEYTLAHGARPSADADLAEHLGLCIDQYYALYREANVMQVVSLDDGIGDGDHDDSDHLLLSEGVRSDAPDPLLVTLLAHRGDLLYRMIRWLPVAERTVVYYYYFDGRSLKEIAKAMGRSESRAHQLHAQALEKLKGFALDNPDLFDAPSKAAAAPVKSASASPAASPTEKVPLEECTASALGVTEKGLATVLDSVFEDLRRKSRQAKALHERLVLSF